MSRLKSADFPTLGRPTMATTPDAGRASGASSSSGRGRGCDGLNAPLPREGRLQRRGCPADEPDRVATADPGRVELGLVLDVVRGATVHSNEVYQLARVRGVLPTDDDDGIDDFGELRRGVLPLHRHRADGIEDLQLLRDVGEMRDEILECPRRLRRLRHHARALHPRELVPLVFGLDYDVVVD